MDTKSKKLSNSFAAKCVAFILCVVFSTMSIVSVVYFADKARDASYEGDIWDILKQDASFVESENFANIVGMTTEQLSTVFELYSISNDTKNNIDNAQYENAFEDIFMTMSQIAIPLQGGDYYENETADNVVFSIDFTDIVPYVTYVEGEMSELDDAINDSQDDNISDKVFFDTSLIEGNQILIKGESDDSGMAHGFLRDISEPGVREELERIYKNELDELRTMLKVNFEKAFKSERDDFARTVSEYGINYFISDGELFLSNVNLTQDNRLRDKTVFNDSYAFFSIVDGDMSNNLSSSSYHRLPINFTDSENHEIFFSFDDEFINFQNNILSELHEEFYSRAILVMACMILVIALLIWLIVVSGRVGEDGTRKLYLLDRIPAEIQIAVALAVMGSIAIAYSYSGRFYYQNEVQDIALQYGFIILGSIIIFTILLWTFLSIVRNIKAGLIIKRSLIYNVCKLFARILKGFGNLIKTGFDKRNPIAKTIILVAALFLIAVLGGMIFMICMMSGDGLFAVLVFAVGIALFTLTLLYTCRFVKKYANFKKGVEEIVEGNLTYTIPVDEESSSEFDIMSKKVNKIGSAINTAVQNELKKELMKTELISNVSHDLKTPLTSIITYTDLLKKEGLKSKNAGEYLDIIDEKGKQLNKLTEDLFAAAKAASGEVPVHKEKVNLLALINQEIVELNGKITDKELDVQIVTSDDNYYVYADSQLIWRVVDNLLTNVSKYALPGSRVYVEIDEEEGSEDNNVGAVSNKRMTRMQIKNISATQLNIPAEELMERFKRGEESRTTSGSGLGLAIAKDLVRIMDGKFDIIIDGDLFKVVVEMPTYIDIS